MAHDVFVCYASEDKSVADAVCGTLEANGIRCWIAPRDVLPGIPYGEAIIDAIHESRIMVLVLSSKANVSGHVPKEIERAVSGGLTVMPLRIEDVRPAKSLDYFIGNVHWLDALTPPLGNHLQRLAANVQTLLSRGNLKEKWRLRPPIVATAPPSNSQSESPAQPSLAVPKDTSRAAIASLVCGIFCLIFVPAAIAAIILGYRARREIRRDGGRQKGAGAAMAGLVLGYIGLTWFVVLVIVLLAVRS